MDSKNSFEFPNGLEFSSKFDNGNLGKVRLITQTTFEIYTVSDNEMFGVAPNPYPKTCFHFLVKGMLLGQTYRFIVRNVNLLWSVDDEVYKPVCRSVGGEWMFLECQATTIQREESYLDLHFQFGATECEMYFAFTFPYTYEDNEELMKRTEGKKGVYVWKEVIAESLQKRKVYLVTISNSNNMTAQKEEHYGEQLFPFREERAQVFKQKPVVLVSARVHPGEAPSSYVMEGMINFLLSDDVRSKALLNNFVFVIIPMLNPDGVYRGSYRMDSENQNLNRYYKSPTYERQPSIFAVRKTLEYFQQRIMFYFDLHAHGSRKSTFFYGNALDNFLDQIQNMTFAKILALNCPAFDYEQCNFSKKQMATKDRFEELTKEGCARVVAHNVTNLVHSYTLECGYYQNCNNQFCDRNSPVYPSVLDDPYDGELGEFPLTNCPALYRFVGKQMLISILDFFDQNPHSKIASTCYATTTKIRMEIGQEVGKLDRFRHFQSIKQIRKTVELIEEQINQRKLLFGWKKQQSISLPPPSSSNATPLMKAPSQTSKSQVSQVIPKKAPKTEVNIKSEANIKSSQLMKVSKGQEQEKEKKTVEQPEEKPPHSDSQVYTITAIHQKMILDAQRRSPESKSNSISVQQSRIHKNKQKLNKLIELKNSYVPAVKQLKPPQNENVKYEKEFKIIKEQFMKNQTFQQQFRLYNSYLNQGQHQATITTSPQSTSNSI